MSLCGERGLHNPCQSSGTVSCSHKVLDFLCCAKSKSCKTAAGMSGLTGFAITAVSIRFHNYFRSYDMYGVLSPALLPCENLLS